MLASLWDIFWNIRASGRSRPAGPGRSSRWKRLAASRSTFSESSASLWRRFPCSRGPVRSRNCHPIDILDTKSFRSSRTRNLGHFHNALMDNAISSLKHLCVSRHTRQQTSIRCPSSRGQGRSLEVSGGIGIDIFGAFRTPMEAISLFSRTRKVPKLPPDRCFGHKFIPSQPHQRPLATAPCTNGPFV